MRTKKQSRKYYLHRVIKKFARIQVYDRKILISQAKIPLIEKLEPREKKYLNEIRQQFGYVIQTTI